MDSAYQVRLRDVIASDIPHFFVHQLDKEANYQAAFTAKNPSDEVAFKAHWARIMQNEKNLKQTIVFQGETVGSLLCFEMFGQQSIAYWIDKQYWGKGIATQALHLFLQQVSIRPLYARVAYDNVGSRRVLEKNGFVLIGEDRGFAEARGSEITEFILELKV